MLFSEQFCVWKNLERESRWLEALNCGKIVQWRDSKRQMILYCACIVPLCFVLFVFNSTCSCVPPVVPLALIFIHHHRQTEGSLFCHKAFLYFLSISPSCGKKKYQALASEWGQKGQSTPKCFCLEINLICCTAGVSVEATYMQSLPWSTDQDWKSRILLLCNVRCLKR